MIPSAPHRRLRIFLSYAREDYKEVFQLYQRLKADGFQPWMDKHDLLPGQKWQYEIPRQVRNADAIIVCLSQIFVKKAGYSQKEIVLALDTADNQPDESVFIIPMRLEECDVPERLRTWQWGDLFAHDGYELIVRALHLRVEQLGLTPHPNITSDTQPDPLTPPPGISPLVSAVPVVSPTSAPKPPASPPPQKPIPTPKPSSSIPTVPAYTPPPLALARFSPIVAIVVGLLLLLGAGVWWIANGGKDDTVAKQPAVVVEPTNTPTPEPTNTPTPEPTNTPPPKPTNTPTPEPTNTPTAMPLTNPLYPTTLDEWRDETSRLSRDFTREGDHYWRYVPGGTYTIGGWYDDEEDDNDAQAEVALPEYWIAKYPVTNQQYRQFIEAGGYANESYWTPNGWAWKAGAGRTQPYWWDDTHFNGDEQPVVGVTWYEATAYANWLNEELAGTLPDGYQVQLPTEAAWEVACAYDANGKRHTYPWGDEAPTRDLADFDDGSDPDRAAVVGGRPDGAAACGAQDMVGTVWEMMNSSYAGYAAESGTIVADFSTNDWVPYLGGSWYNSDTLNITRCAARNWFRLVNDLNGNDGVRVGVSPRLPERMY